MDDEEKKREREKKEERRERKKEEGKDRMVLNGYVKIHRQLKNDEQ